MGMSAEVSPRRRRKKTKDRIESQQLSALIESSLEGVTPGVLVRAYKGGRKVIDLACGKTYRFYDLASLTKIIFTTTAFMQLETRLKKSVTSLKVNRYLPWMSSQTTVKHLLTHSAGLNWWEPFYKSVKVDGTPEEKFLSLEPLLGQLKGEPGERAVYSDPDMLNLGALLMRLEEKSLYEIWGGVAKSLGEKSTLHFNLNNTPKYARSKYAPTENCPWRKKILQGEVHDENAWSLGGVAPHAGLFGTIDDVSHWGLKLRKLVLAPSPAKRKPPTQMKISSTVAQKYVRRAIPPAQGDWALGFMMPTPGKASSGKYFSPKSIGHTGFTGTSFWFDPVNDLMVVILSNRVHPTRENQKFLALRPLIHNWIFETIFNGEISS